MTFEVAGMQAAGPRANRASAWARLHDPWDLLIIGGGITGASLHAEAARRGLRTLLVEARDFAAGASGHSGQLVHGGMRYLRQGQWRLTRQLLRERDRLLGHHGGLVDPLPFVLPTYRDRPADRVAYGAAVRLYDLLRLHRRSWRRLALAEVAEQVPGVRGEGLDGGYQYGDAVTDDARLVLWHLRAAERAGGVALNYVRVAGVRRDRGRVVGADVVDNRTGQGATIRAAVVVNATGAEADVLRESKAGAPRLRPIRGTHLVIPRTTLPLRSALGYRHPATGRYQYLVPWDDVVLVGTTDVDGGDDGDDGDGAPRASAAEVAHLLEGVRHVVPGAELEADAVVASFAGVRPVADRTSGDPSRARRTSVLWDESGLLTVISGKLTGFQGVVDEAFRRISARVPARRPPTTGRHGLPDAGSPGASPAGPAPDGVPPWAWRRLAGRHGVDAPAVIAAAGPGELETIPGTRTLWVELRWGARAEGVEQLDDLLLRRTRIGMQLPDGGAAAFPRLREICREELGWDADRWAAEAARFAHRWSRQYAPSR